MRKRILAYSKRIDELLENDLDTTNWKEVLEEHLTQIQFFQHERIIHLIVTVAFAICGFLSIFGFVYVSYLMSICFLIIFGMLFPYVNHYFLLERNVQKMYSQYDRILEKIRK